MARRIIKDKARKLSMSQDVTGALSSSVALPFSASDLEPTSLSEMVATAAAPRTLIEQKQRKAAAARAATEAQQAATFIAPTPLVEKQVQRQGHEQAKMFLRVLLKYLQQSDPSVHAKAKAAIQEWEKGNVQSLSSAMRDTVGEVHWNCAISLFHGAREQAKKKNGSKQHRQEDPSGSNELPKPMPKPNKKKRKKKNTPSTLSSSSVVSSAAAPRPTNQGQGYLYARRQQQQQPRHQQQYSYPPAQQTLYGYTIEQQWYCHSWGPMVPARPPLGVPQVLAPNGTPTFPAPGPYYHHVRWQQDQPSQMLSPPTVLPPTFRARGPHPPPQMLPPPTGLQTPSALLSSLPNRRQKQQQQQAATSKQPQATMLQPPSLSHPTSSMSKTTSPPPQQQQEQEILDSMEVFSSTKDPKQLLDKDLFQLLGLDVHCHILSFLVMSDRTSARNSYHHSLEGNLHDDFDAITLGLTNQFLGLSEMERAKWDDLEQDEDRERFVLELSDSADKRHEKESSAITSTCQTLCLVSKEWKHATGILMNMQALAEIISAADLSKLKSRALSLSLSSVFTDFNREVERRWGDGIVPVPVETKAKEAKSVLKTLRNGFFRIPNAATNAEFQTKSIIEVLRNGFGGPKAFFEIVAFEYTRFLVVKCVEIIAIHKHPSLESPVVQTWSKKCAPNPLIDAFWFAHTMSPKYAQNCRSLIGDMIESDGGKHQSFIIDHTQDGLANAGASYASKRGALFQFEQQMSRSDGRFGDDGIDRAALFSESFDVHLMAKEIWEHGCRV